MPRSANFLTGKPGRLRSTASGRTGEKTKHMTNQQKKFIRDNYLHLSDWQLSYFTGLREKNVANYRARRGYYKRTLPGLINRLADPVHRKEALKEGRNLKHQYHYDYKELNQPLRMAA